MKRPIESDYTSQVAYTRALEAYCDTLAQPEQEPVAVVTGVYGGRFTYAPFKSTVVLPVGAALYLAPPQRKPLTDEEINDIAKNYALNNPTTPLHFARAIEAAHGIKE